MKSSRAMRGRSGPDRARLAAARVALLGALLLAWEAGARTRAIDPYFVSLPSEIGRTIGGWMASGFIYGHLLATMVFSVYAPSILIHA